MAKADDIINSAQQFAAVRTAPGIKVSPAAFAAATTAAGKLAQTGGRWQEVTNQPYNSDALGYRDPTWSNSSGGARLVAGRMTALAVDGNALYAGAAAGGVWKSTDRGGHWTQVFGQQNNLSIGALAVDPADHSIWVGTGEPNTSQDSYAGNGIYRSADGGRSWQLVGNSLPNRLVYSITFDGAGSVYAATSYGLLKRPALDLTSSWKTVLKPDPNPTNSPYRTSFVTDVKVQPGTGGNVVIAALGWRGGTLPTDLAVQRLLRVGQRRQDLQQGHADRRAEGRDGHRPDQLRLLRRRQAALRGDRIHRHGRAQGRVPSRRAAAWRGRGSCSRTPRR